MVVIKCKCGTTVNIPDKQFLNSQALKCPSCNTICPAALEDAVANVIKYQNQNVNVYILPDGKYLQSAQPIFSFD